MLFHCWEGSMMKCGLFTVSASNSTLADMPGSKRLHGCRDTRANWKWGLRPMLAFCCGWDFSFFNGWMKSFGLGSLVEKGRSACWKMSLERRGMTREDEISTRSLGAWCFFLSQTFNESLRDPGVHKISECFVIPDFHRQKQEKSWVIFFRYVSSEWRWGTTKRSQLWYQVRWVFGWSISGIKTWGFARTWISGTQSLGLSRWL